MNEKEFIIDFRKKSYKFTISEIDDSEQTILINYKSNPSKSCIIKIAEIFQYLSILNNSIENNHDTLEEKIQEYIEFIHIIGHELQIKQAIEQLMILLWNNLDYVKQNLEILNFFEKYMEQNIELIKYYYFLIFYLTEITITKEINKSYLSLEMDWHLDNLGLDHEDFIEESNITEFIIR